MKKRKIGISGYMGFIASNLVPFLEDEYEVLGWDIRSDHDLFKADDLLGCDTIVHLAALTNVNESFKKPAEYSYTNMLGTAHMLELCIKSQATMIYPSSAAIMEPESSPYAFSKYIAHNLIESVMDKVPANIFTLYNVYGMNPPKGSLFYNFLHDEKLIIHGDGKQTRDFINVKDVCRLIKLAIDEQWRDIEMAVGMGRTTSVLDIAKIFQKYTGKEIVFEEKINAGIRESKAERHIMDELVNFDLLTNLDRDIKNMVMNFN